MKNFIITKITKITATALAVITLGAAMPTAVNPAAPTSVSAKTHHKRRARRHTKRHANNNVASFVIYPTRHYPKHVGVAKTNYDVPKIKKFNKSVQKKYHLMGNRWRKLNLTVNTNALGTEEKSLISDAIARINTLGILHLTKTTHKADLTVKNKHLETGTLGDAAIYMDLQPLYKNLMPSNSMPIDIDKAQIKAYADTVDDGQNDHHRLSYERLYERVALHEFGHTFGLDHDSNYSDNIMSANESPNLSITLDQDYITRLALLYQN